MVPGNNRGKKMNDISERKFSWGDESNGSFEAFPKDVPEESLFVLAQRGWTHVFGNEVASAFTAWRKTDDGKAADEVACKSWLAERRGAKLMQILEGKLGVRVAGAPRVTGVDAVMRSIATKRVAARLAALNIKMPTGENVIEIKKEKFTRDQLIKRMLDTNEASIRKDAEQRMAEDSAAAANADDLFAE
jgi:hypothetical protein